MYEKLLPLYANISLRVIPLQLKRILQRLIQLQLLFPCPILHVNPILLNLIILLLITKIPLILVQILIKVILCHLINRILSTGVLLKVIITSYNLVFSLVNRNLIAIRLCEQTRYLLLCQFLSLLAKNLTLKLHWILVG